MNKIINRWLIILLLLVLIVGVREAVTEPITDRWGTLITALIPLKDPQTEKLVAVLGMDVNANDWTKEIIGHCFIPFVVMLLFAVSILLMASRKQVAKALKESEIKHRLFFENAPIGIIHYNRQGIVTDVNKELTAILGATRGKLLGLNMLDLPNKLMTNEISKSFNGERGYYEGEYTSYTGNKTSQIEVNWFPVFKDGDFADGIGIVEDITRRKNAEETLARRMELERLISGISSEFVGLDSDEIDAGINRALASVGAVSGADRAYVFIFQHGGKLIDNTHEWCAEGTLPQIDDLKGIPLAEELPWFTEQILKHEVFHVPNVADLPSQAQLEREHFESQNIKSLIVAPMRLGDRLMGFLGIDAVRNLQTWTEDDQALLRLVSETFANAIERKKAEKKQKILQSRLISAIEMAHLGPWEYDVVNDLIILNDHFYKVFRTTAKQVGGYTMSPAEFIRRFVHPDDMQFVLEKFSKSVEAANPHIIQQMDHRILFPDGTVGYVSAKYATIKDASGKTVKGYGVDQDVTERKLSEERLRQSEEKLARSRKMESLGLLAGGVAHDLNNVLSGIVSYPELLLIDLPENSRLRKPIETIQDSGNKAVDIVQDLLTIARGVASTKKPLNLNYIVKEYLGSPEFNKLEQFHPAVRVKTNLDPELFYIGASLVHIRKVVMNLVSNAAEAIEGGGNVIVSTRNCYVDRPVRGYEDVNPGEYAVLAVSDDGSGILPEYLERIFEPFFSKKVMGRSGTGLGLAVVWNIVQDHEGYVDVTSNKNGTIFELYFPVTRDKISNKILSVPIEELKGNGESILVVDDVESQREISCKMLDVLGYKTKAISGGKEAVKYLKENKADLILLDMIMDPGINGRETYEKIIEIHPGQKAVIVSGFSETDEMKAAQKLGAGEYIKKPLTLEKIGLAIKAELRK